MKVKLRCDSKGRFGLVEQYKRYFYDYRRVSILALVNVFEGFSEPYVLRAGEFIPAAQIEEEMGISAYTKAKKPFYSVIGTGNAVLHAQIAMRASDAPDGGFIYLPDKSSYSLYGLKQQPTVNPNGEMFVNLSRISTTTSQLEEWFQSLGKDITEACGDDREIFLKTRFSE